MKKIVKEIGMVAYIAALTFIVILALIGCNIQSHAQYITNRIVTYQNAISNHPSYLYGGFTNGSITNYFYNVAGASNTNSTAYFAIPKLSIYNYTNVFGSGNNTNTTSWYIELPILCATNTGGLAGQPMKLYIVNGLVVGITNY